MFQQRQFELDFAGRKLTVEFGKLARQANAACTVRYGDTVVLATAVISEEPRVGVDFLPLVIEVQERMYAAGKIKGSRFVKREGRPSDKAILGARMIDRGIRPLFNQDLRHEIQVVSTALSYDDENLADILSITAAGIALHVSDIPWSGPLAGVCVGKVNGQMIINPTVEQLSKSDYKLVFSVSGDRILMMDTEAREATEENLLEGFAFGLEQIKPLLAFIEKIRKEIGLTKKDESALIQAAYAEAEIPLQKKQLIFEQAKKFFSGRLDKYLFNQPKGTKRERKEIASVLLDEFFKNLSEKDQHPEIIKYIKDNFDRYLEGEVSRAILEKDLRVDGRALDQTRPLDSIVGLLPRTHGSGLFSRGETQVLSVVTLGSPGAAQILDEMTEDDTKKRYMHFYNCPPYSFGETGPFRGAGRREIGHGALTEKALLPVLPEKIDFPYTIMVVSEVMGSNGSSSMASTCGSTLALMDAGVPIKKPVAGIAMGLASTEDNYKVLTDLQDLEDGEGGMDFKVAGTKDGITAIQMDTKTKGLNLEICRAALIQAKKARLEIIDHLTKIIAAPRAELSVYAPRIITCQIEPKKIGDVIGSGGKIINEIIDACGVEIDIEDDGLVTITGQSMEGVDRALNWVKNLTKEVAVGEIYEGQVKQLFDFGAVVEFLPGREGLVHISEFSSERVNQISDVAEIGQTLKVKVINVEDSGKISLSVKQSDPNYNPDNDQRRPFNQDRRGGPRHQSPRKKFGFIKRH